MIFGRVLYEMLTGKGVSGRDAPDTIARILEREPDWQALPAPTRRRISGDCSGGV